MSTPSRFLAELPRELLAGPAMERSAELGDDQAAGGWVGDGPDGDGAVGEHAPGPLDLDLVFGRRGRSGLTGLSGPRGTGALGRRRAFHGGLGPVSRTRRGEAPLTPFTPSSEAPPATATVAESRERAAAGPPAAGPRTLVPGERAFRDGDRVRHPAFGQGVVVTSKLTRADEEVTVAFPERGVKTLLASVAGLERVP
jgi:DNA helicase-2/ATP-dependent DNA helicase PcrA